MDDPLIKEFLDRIKAEGRSSPAGMHWMAFHDLLTRHASRIGTEAPPMPLILAASGEADNTKHRRLREQLRWALEHGVLAEALQFLNALRPDQWNWGTAENWHRSFYAR
jgi:hypothetical protein